MYKHYLCLQKLSTASFSILFAVTYYLSQNKNIFQTILSPVTTLLIPPNGIEKLTGAEKVH